VAGALFKQVIICCSTFSERNHQKQMAQSFEQNSSNHCKQKSFVDSPDNVKPAASGLGSVCLTFIGVLGNHWESAQSPSNDDFGDFPMTNAAYQLKEAPLLTM
jgi:hypothetical protein